MNPTPFIDASGLLVIPTNSDHKYHWWNGGQPIYDTLLEINAPQEVIDAHVPIKMQEIIDKPIKID